MKNNLYISLIITILFHLCAQGKENTRVKSTAEEFDLTEKQAKELVEYIDAYTADMKAELANLGVTQEGEIWTPERGPKFPDRHIKQAVTLYNSISRETTPAIGMTRKIPESLLPYYKDGRDFVRLYEKSMTLKDLKNYLHMVGIMSILDHKQLTNFIAQVSVKSVPAKVDCALDSYITEFLRENAKFSLVDTVDYEAVLPEEDMLILKQWSRLHNPVFRSLGMDIAHMKIRNEEQMIDFLKPYSEETDKILFGGLIHAYRSIGNPARKNKRKDKLLELGNIAARRGDAVSEEAAWKAIGSVIADDLLLLIEEFLRGDVAPSPVDLNADPFLNEE